MKRVTDLIIRILVSLLVVFLFLYHNCVSIYWQAFKIEFLLAVLGIVVIVLVLCILRISAETKEKFKDAFDVSKPIKKLTPDDFHIINYNKFYIERESDKNIETLLKERKCVFIIGIPGIGKTRMAYEAIKKLKDFYLLKPAYKEIDLPKLKLPFFKKKIVLFLDDLDKYVGKLSVDDLIRKLKGKSKDFIVIATCRSGKEYDQVFAQKEMETLLTECEKGKIEPRLLHSDEQNALARAIGKSVGENAFDGTPGSTIIDLRYMENRYHGLGDEKAILKSLKLLREGNVLLAKENLVKEVSKRIFELDTKRTRWDDYIRSLLENGFIKKLNGWILVSHDVYLDDRFLNDYFVKDRDIEILKIISFHDLKDAEVLFQLGNSFYYKKNLYQAEDCYRKSIRITPDSAEAHYNLGNVLYELKRYQEAEKEYIEALRIKPHSAEAHYNLGNLLSESGKYLEAEREYKETLRINPDDALAYAGLADVYVYKYEAYYDRSLSVLDEAERASQKALMLNPELPEAHRSLGRIFMFKRMMEDAIKEFKEAIRLRPNFYEVCRILGWIYDESKNFEEAEKWAKKALEIRPSDKEALLLLGIIYFDQQFYDLALETFYKASDVAPDYSTAFYYIGSTFLKLGKFDQASEKFNKCIDTGGDPNVYLDLGWIFLLKKDYPNSLESFQKSIDSGYFEFIAFYFLGLVHQQTNNDQKAKECYRKTVQLCSELLKSDPQNPYLHSTLSLAYLALGEEGKAEQEIKISEKLAPENGAILYDLARFYALKKDEEKSLKFLKQALKLPLGPSKFEVRLDPHFKNLQKNPSFVELTKT